MQRMRGFSWDRVFNYGKIRSASMLLSLVDKSIY